MKLLLTSAGFTNDSIVTALTQMVEKPFEELKIAFIPTAANVERGDKRWLIQDYEDCKRLGFKQIDIVDISALSKEQWLPRLQEADILMFGGGNTFHLMHWINKSGLAEVLPELLNTRIYIGVSAGSMVATHNLVLSDSPKLYREDTGGKEKVEGLGLVQFHVRPHLNSPYFPHVRADTLETIAEELKEPIYALDDDSAIQVIDSEIKVVSRGQALKFN